MLTVSVTKLYNEIDAATLIQSSGEYNDTIAAYSSDNLHVYKIYVDSYMVGDN